MEIRTIKEIPEIKGKKIIIRVDFNVPLGKDGKIEDDTRIVEALETIKFLRDKGGKLIIMTHLGRPDGKVKEELRVTKIAKHLERLLKSPVKKLDEVIGKEVSEEIEKLKKGEIIMLENLRFKKEEEKNDKNFAKELASLADIYVNDAFGTAHRAHASTAGIAEFIPAYGGLLIEKEMKALSPLINQEPARPLTMIFGGAKIDTKIGVIRQFIDKADYVLIGGALANTFLYAAGYNIGESLCEKDKKEVAQDIMLEFEEHQEKFILPHDVVVASEISDEAETLDLPIQDVMGDMKIGDIGKLTVEKYCRIIKASKTIIWNGPMGVYEYEPFENGTLEIADCIANHKCESIIGGGDTADAMNKLGFKPENFTHISTGGGACIEFLEGKVLPGIKALLK
jgi:phosphoglycerate kinase